MPPYEVAVLQDSVRLPNRCPRCRAGHWHNFRFWRSKPKPYPSA